MGSHSLLQSIFLTRGLNPGLLHCRQILYCLTANVMPVLFADGIKTALISFTELFPDFSLGVSNKCYGFSSDEWMWELDHKESWAQKNWCFWTAVLEKTLESLGLQGDPTSHPKGDQSWVFTGRTDVEAEAPILWPPDAKSWFIEKDPDAGKDWKCEKKGSTEYKMIGMYHQLNGCEFV